MLSIFNQVQCENKKDKFNFVYTPDFECFSQAPPGQSSSESQVLCVIQNNGCGCIGYRVSVLMAVVVDFVIVVTGFGVVCIEFGCLVWELLTALRDLPPIVDIDLHLHLFLKNKKHCGFFIKFSLGLE